MAMTRRSLPASWSGLSGITVTMVVQFGQATMPRWPLIACALTSGTTRGTAGSMRKALDLSTTTAPAFTACGAYSFDWAEPAEKSAMSTPLNDSGPTLSMRMVSPLKVTVLPTERSEANARSALTGNLRSSRSLSVVCPTAPVTPTTATVSPEAMCLPSPACQEYDRSTSPAIRSPISLVPTSFMPAAWMSRVRCPCSSTRKTAASIRSASPPMSRE